MSDRTWYEILQISPAATEEEIKAAYRARTWTPAGAVSQEELRQLNEAFAVLSNPSRRAAYDASLAHGAQASASQAEATLPRSQPQPVLADDEPIPPGPLLLRMWGLVTHAFWQLSHARYYFIPFSWVLSVMLIGLSGYLMSEWQVAVRDPNPVALTVPAVVREVPADRYIAVEGFVEHELGYEVTGRVNEYYYAVYDGPNLIYVKGYTSDEGPVFSGRMRPFEGKLLKMVQEEAQDPFFEDVKILTTHYLDTTYTPPNPALYSSGLFAIGLVLLIMLAAALRRYTVFVAADLGTDGPSAPALSLPRQAQATGRFRPAEGGGMGFFQVGTPVLVAQNEESGTGLSLETWVRKGQTERLHEIAIPPGSDVRTGFDYTGGSASPALAIRTGRQTVYLRLPTMAEARAVARAIAG